MNAWEFDQSESGWRKIAQTQGFAAAAAAVHEFLTTHDWSSDSSLEPQLLWFHLGQLYATEGNEHYAQAAQAIEHATIAGRDAWNAYVEATLGFLAQDAGRIEAALRLVEASTDPDANVRFIRAFHEAALNGETDYRAVYERAGKQR